MNQPSSTDDDNSVALSDYSEVHDDAVGHKAHQAEERKTLARRENQAVYYLRVAVYLVVFITTVLVCLGVYIFTENDEESDFESEFSAYANKLLESFQDALGSNIGTMNTFSTAITTMAIASGAQFPMVTVPNWEVFASTFRIQTGAVVVNWYPKVENEQVEEWQSYANVSHQWLLPAFMRDMGLKMAQDAKYEITKAPTAAPMAGEEPVNPLADLKPYHYNIINTLGDFVEENSGPHLILWQMSPVTPVPHFLNYDLLTNVVLEPPFRAAMESGKVIVSESLHGTDPEDDGNTDALYNAYLALGQYRHQPTRKEGDPLTAIVHPVFSDFGPNRTVVGLTTASIYWRLMFTNLLPDKDISVICVMSNTKGELYTFRLDGPEVTYLGLGDQHNPKFDKMGVFQNVAETLTANEGPQNQAFLAADLDTEYNSYSLAVYPTDDMEDYYLTRAPIHFTLVVAAIFVFTSLVFIAYDLFVGRRQRIVMKRAVESGALVASLYPQQVRDRLFEESNDDKNKKGSIWQSNGNGDGGNIDNLATDDDVTSKVIAEYYEHTTILFADLAGFTSWSSKRKPEEVFILLESLYQAFDKIAFRRHVYKIETVGDCYVAVTGVPEAQPDHAVRMAKFARDCQLKMAQLIGGKLLAQLGQDTADLKFRVGLHSGPITGGVLRGQKSRFQLFGDTINTASRMESNGIPNKIHVSEDTANELIAQGYSTWLTEREGGVEAKGKGQMRTFFVTVPETKSHATKSSLTVSSCNSVGTGENDEPAQPRLSSLKSPTSTDTASRVPTVGEDVEC